MSFRLRVLGLLMLVAMAATAATAWLTLRQANNQVRESARAGQEEVSRILDGMTTYGFVHGTWEGAAPTVRSLSAATGQRIRVVTETDVLVADSDVLAGRPAREVSGRPPVLADARPRLRLPAAKIPRASVKRTVTAITDYRASVAYAACLTSAGAAVTARPDSVGIPRVQADRRPAQCKEPTAGDSAPYVAQDSAAAVKCESDPRLSACLQRVFNERTLSVAPPRLQIGLGALDESPAGLAAAPTVAVAGAVALAAIVAALVLSRAVLRPVRALTAAARGLGGGDLEHRVPVTGRDEIAELGRAFNRMADSLRSAEERQRRMTGDIAHELRTPLANLRGYLEALQDGFVEPTPELLDSLHEEAMLQQRIVDDLQDLALAEAGVLTYHRAVTDLRNVLDASRTAHRATAEQAGVALELAAPLPVHAAVDPDRLRQVIGNLVGNALRATAPGGTVTLELRREGRTAVIRVRDTGEGIPAEHLPQLFDRFWRADPARGRATGGSGLGLAIAQQIVTDHGGTIGVESVVGTGTTFVVALTAVTE
ncbi:ATP-binding protein [Streptomyces sp. NBC_01463]|uniref:sensor histidine kinase n=1 Tax=Streptomyces sp. NPDC050392 TaxID=3155782 RepID=UPI0032567E1A